MELRSAPLSSNSVAIVCLSTCGDLRPPTQLILPSSSRTALSTNIGYKALPFFVCKSGESSDVSAHFKESCVRKYNKISLHNDGRSGISLVLSPFPTTRITQREKSTEFRRRDISSARRIPVLYKILTIRRLSLASGEPYSHTPDVDRKYSVIASSLKNSGRRFSTEGFFTR